MNNNYSVGGSVDGWCTKCKLELSHTIVSLLNNMPARVKCNTCNSEHNFRTKKSPKSGTRTAGASKSRATRKKAESPEVKYNDYMSRLSEQDLSRATKYSMDGSFRKEEVIDHFKFGIGIVLSVTQANKIEILFKDGPKILVQNIAAGTIL